MKLIKWLHCMEQKKEPLPIFRIAIDYSDGKTREKIEVTGSKMSDFTIIRRPNINDIKFWNTLRVTALSLRFARNSLAKQHHEKRKRGRLTTEEIMQARDYWVRREQRSIPKTTERPGWKVSHDEETKILKCVGRIRGYEPTYLENKVFAQKLIRHTHEQGMHYFGKRKQDGSREGELVDTKAEISG